MVFGPDNPKTEVQTMTALAIETPALRLWDSPSTPNQWVVENLDTGELFFVPAVTNGWAKRHPYRGYRAALRPVAGYNFVGLGIPLRRPWPDVCKDRTGCN